MLLIRPFSHHKRESYIASWKVLLPPLRLTAYLALKEIDNGLKIDGFQAVNGFYRCSEKERITELGWRRPLSAQAISEPPRWLVVRLGRLKHATPLEADGARNVKIIEGWLDFIPPFFSLDQVLVRSPWSLRSGFSYLKEVLPKARCLIRRPVIPLNVCP